MEVQKQKPEIPNEARQILNRVGLALIVFGLLDIGVMIYCLVNRISYSSSFNIFAVISGIYLRRGHPWYVKWVTRSAGFYAAALCFVVPGLLILLPLDLSLLELRLHPVGLIASSLVALGLAAFLIWVYRELRRAPVLAAFARSGYSPGPAWGAPFFGAMLAVVVGVLFALIKHGEPEQKAIALATAKTGPGYHYFVTYLNYSGNRGSAEVLAYDAQNIRTVSVEW